MNNATIGLEAVTSILDRTGQICTAIGLILLLALASPASQAQGYTEDPLYGFIGPEGSTPYSTLVNVSGKLYGTTQEGGGHSLGSVFSYDPATNTEATVYLFGDNSSGDGASSYAGMIYDSTRKLLYGTTYQGGSAGMGTIFSIDPATNAERIVYSIGSGTGDGANPIAGLIEVNGILYGTTQQGGTVNDGTVFSFDLTARTFRTIHSFSGGDGLSPHSALTYDSATGKLYGTTQEGGTGNNDVGTIFSIDPTTDAFSTIYGFTGQADGGQPFSGLLDVNGILYGTTYYGGTNSNGTVFSINASTHTFSSLYSFGTNSTSDGVYPYADLTYDSTSGKLFGSTQYGGANSHGMIFSFDLTSKSEAIVYNFTDTNSDGASPFASLLDMNGTFYGTTGLGGTGGYGTVFSLTPVVATAPVAVNHYVKVTPNTTLNDPAPGVLGGVNNGGSTPVTAALVANVTHGTLTLNSNGGFVYTPTTGFLGTDTFTYQAINSVGKSNIATVYLTVQPTAPIAVNHYVKVTPNTALTDPAPGVLGGVNNGGSSPMTAVLVTNVTHGALTLNSDGSFVYTPNTSFLGTDLFTYQAKNAVGTSNTATVYLTVQPTAPIAVNHYVKLTHNTTLNDPAPGVLGGVNNGGSSPMTAALVTNVTHGTLTLNNNGGFTYTPTTGFVGNDSFTYQAVNAIGKSNTATVYLTVQ